MLDWHLKQSEGKKVRGLFCVFMCDTHALGLGFTPYEVVRTIFCPYMVEIKHVCSCYEQPHLKMQLKLAFVMRWKM